MLAGGADHAPIRLAFRSLGCRTNQDEMNSLIAACPRHNAEAVDDPAFADVLVINTCTVTAHTEATVRRGIMSAARQYPHVKIAVTGCLAQQKAAEIARYPNVAWVVDNVRKSDLLAIVASGAPGIHAGVFDAAAPLGLDADAAVLPPSKARRTRFSIKIQEGCDFSCAYCIVPLVRGASRSAGRKAVHALLLRALDAGYKEIVLTGTHIGQYRDADEDLASLVAALAGTQGDFRIRLSSLDPRDLDDRLIDLIAAHPRLCRHAHISAQSLCDTVLQRMNRGAVSAAGIASRIEALRRLNPEIGLGCDIIVGFPNETDAEFGETAARLRDIGFTYGHVFRYSRRPGTAAATMAGQAPAPVQHERSLIIRDIIAGSRNAGIARLLGKPQRILIERELPATGLTSCYLRLVCPGQTALHNSWFNAVPTACHNGIIEAIMEQKA